jgi:hypothetical protein
MKRLVLVLGLPLAACTTADITTEVGSANISRFWSDAAVTGQRDCSVLGVMPVETLSRLTFQQMLLLCSGNLTYSSTAGDPALAQAIGQLGLAASKAAVAP